MSGVASLSRTRRMTLLVPCLAAVSSAEPLPLGLLLLLPAAAAVDAMCCCESSEGRLVRSVEEEENVCANQPERRLGRSVRRVVEDEDG